MKERKIDFLVIGTQKGGTSAMDFYLRQHPDIGMAKEKEVHFFDNDFLFENERINYSNYHEHFDFGECKKVYGESTPIYLYWEACCKRIWDYNKDIKLIAILRNPIDRAYSQWNMEYERKTESELFEFCIHNEKKRLGKTLMHQHPVYSYIDRGYYTRQIIRFRKYFPCNQLLFVKYENYKKNQNKTLSEIYKFLGIDSSTHHIDRIEFVLKTNYIQEMKKCVKAYLSSLYLNEIHEVENLLNWNCSDWLE